jgi:hypothetical protein
MPYSVVEVGSIKHLVRIRFLNGYLGKTIRGKERAEVYGMFYVYCYMAAFVICILSPSLDIINQATRYYIPYRRAKKL